jgi:hypothetical protein
LGIALIYLRLGGVPHMLEICRQGLQLCIKPHFNQRFAQNFMGFQSHKNPNFRNFGTPNLRVLRQNDIWMQAMWPSTDNTIRGKWWLSPSPGHGESCESVFARGSFMHQKRSNYSLTNLLFGLCMSVWIIDPLVTHLSPHPRAPTRPFTPEVLQIREHTSTPYPSVFFTLGSRLNLSRSLGVHQWWFARLVSM